jgi:hypothetical protein
MGVMARLRHIGEEVSGRGLCCNGAALVRLEVRQFSRREMCFGHEKARNEMIVGFSTRLARLIFSSCLYR